jgi:hypothetical protein
MGERISWRWLKTPTNIWAKIWKCKYAPNTHQNQLIRMQEKIQGSNIWNVAWTNRPLIQEHAFWEVHNGHNALFWMDSWKKIQTLQLEENLQSYENHIQDLTTLKVEDLCTDTPIKSPWRRWKSTDREL